MTAEQHSTGDHPSVIHPTAKIHPTAVLDPSVEVGADVEIGPHCVVGPNVKIGARSRLIHLVSIVQNTELGEENVLYPGVVIGADPQDRKFAGEPSWVKVGNHNELREHVTIHRGTSGGGLETRIGDHCLLMAGAHIAHDCVLGNYVTLANQVLLGGHTVFEDHVGVGGHTAFHHFTTVGRFAFIGGFTRVARDVPPFMITEGSPSKVRTINKVGLRRNDFSEETMQWMKDAHRLLFFEGVVREEAFERLAEKGPIPPEGEYLFQFMKRSEEGHHGRALQP